MDQLFWTLKLYNLEGGDPLDLRKCGSHMQTARDWSKVPGQPTPKDQKPLSYSISFLL